MKEYMKGKSVLRSMVFIMLSFAMVWTMIPGLFGSGTAFAEAGDLPAHEKNLKVNDDGTYTLSLSVTGEAEKQPSKANVIVVFDTSSSMNERTGNQEVTYTPTDSEGGWFYNNNLYGLIDGQYVPLSRSYDWREESLVFYYQGQRYTGQRYFRQAANQTRLQAAESAVNDLAKSLLAYNGADGNPEDTIEMALVDFANMAEIAQAPTTNYEDFSATVNSRNAGNNDRGTNWEAGLRKTLDVDFGDEDPTYVIFVSDGNPTFYVNDNGTRGGTGQETGDNVQTSYNQAIPAAKKVVDEGYEFYTIGIYGNVDRMEGLTTESGASADHYYSADNTAALQEALAEILSKIEMAGIGAAKVEDGTTSKVTTSSGTAHLLDVDVDSYKYWRAGGDYGNDNDGLGTEWKETDTPAPPEASLNGDGEVVWDLSELGVLENGVTYTVTFDVWPSQEALDYVADMKNGVAVPEEVKQYLNEDGSLKTNTTATLDYDDTRTTDKDEEAIEYDNPDPVETKAAELLAITKEWDNALEPAPKDELTLKVTRDGDEKYSLILNDPDWKNNVFISLGIMRTVRTGDDDKMEILTPGHDFTFTEPEELSYHWELDVPTVHPMLIDGEVTTLIKVDDAHPAGDAKVYTINGSKYYVGDAEAANLTATNHHRSSVDLAKVVTGENAPADAEFPFTLNVVNSNEANGSQDKTDSDYYVWFSVQDKDGKPVNDAVKSGATAEDGSNGWYYAKSGDDVVINMKAGYNVRVNNVPTGTTYTFTEGELPAGFIFKEAEGSVIGSEGTADSIKAGRTSTGTIESTNKRYKVTYTNEYAQKDVSVTKVWDDADNQDGKRPETLELTLNGLPTGTTAPTPEVTKSKDGNTWTYTWKGVPKYDSEGKEITYTVSEDAVPEGYSATGTPAQVNGTIKNTYTPEKTSVTVKKTWVGPEAKGGATVHLLANGTDTGKTAKLSKDNNNTFTFDNLDKFANGTAITYSVTEDAVAGYSTTGPTGEGTEEKPFEFTNTNAETVDVTVTKEWSDSDDEDKIRPEKLDLTLTAPEGIEVPDPEVKKSGSTWTYTWKGLPKYPNGAEFEYTVSEENVPAGYKVTGSPAKNGGTITNKHSTVEADIIGLKELKNYSGNIPTGKFFFTIEGTFEPAEETAAEQKPADENKNTEAAAEQPADNTAEAAEAADKKAEEAQADADVKAEQAEEAQKKADEASAEGSADAEKLQKAAEETKAEAVEAQAAADETKAVAEEAKKEAAETKTEEATAEAKEPAAESESAKTEAKAADASESGSSADTAAPLPEKTKVTNDSEGKIVFGKIKFDKPGKYTYTITESGSMDRVTNDPKSTRTVVVTVAYDDNGDLKATFEPGDTYKFTFTNTYEPPVNPGVVSIDPPVKKIVEGNAPKKAETYTFMLRAADPSNPMPVAAGGEQIMTMDITGAGEKEFGEIKFTKEGVYDYTINEVAGTNSSCEYDDTVYVVRATVTADKDGKLQVKREYFNDGELIDVAALEFVNTYDDDGEPGVGVKTGDDNNIPGAVGGFFASLAALFGAFKLRRKNNRNDA